MAKSGKINLFTNYQINTIRGKNKLEGIEIKHDDGNVKDLNTDFVLGFLV